MNGDFAEQTEQPQALRLEALLIRAAIQKGEVQLIARGLQSFARGPQRAAGLHIGARRHL